MATSNESTSVAFPEALTPVLSDKYVLRWQHAALCGVFALLFVYVSYLPLPHAVLWGHVQQGQQIVANRAVAATSAHLPLSEGMTVVNTSWLSQVVFAGLESWRGAEALSWLLAVSVLASVLLLARAFYLQTGRKRFALLGVLIVVALWWSQLGLLGPRTLGMVCFATLIWLLARVKPAQSLPLAYWFAIPGLLAVWANLDASFLVGAALLVCFAAGQAIDMAWKSRSVKNLLRDRPAQSRIWLAELAILATVIHPLGLTVWSNALSLTSNPYWQALGGWRPLALAVWPGIGIAAVWLTLLIAARHSTRRVSATECLLFGAASIAVICNANMIVWFAPIAALVVVPHIADIAGRWMKDKQKANSDEASEEAKPLRFAFTLLCVLLVWCTFSLTPISTPVLGGEGRTAEQLYSSETPRNVASFLRDNPSKGLVFAPADWGDWLIWSGPEDIKVYANSDVNRLPAQAQLDYVHVFAGQGNWTRTLDKYGVATLVVNKQRQKTLSESVMRAGAGWTIIFEDDRAIVLNRRIL